MHAGLLLLNNDGLRTFSSKFKGFCFGLALASNDGYLALSLFGFMCWWFRTFWCFVLNTLLILVLVVGFNIYSWVGICELSTFVGFRYLG